MSISPASHIEGLRLLNQGHEMTLVSSLRCHPENPRRGDLEAIKRSIRRHGFYGALIVQRHTRYILAGNHRFKAAKALGYKELPVVWVDVDETTAREILAVDNKTSDLGTYDPKQIAQLLKAIDSSAAGDLLSTGWTKEEYDELLGALGGDRGESSGGEGDGSSSSPGLNEDAFEAGERAKAKWGVEVGQIWRVGRHRVMCGSSTRREDLEALIAGETVNLVVADPPYGIRIVKTDSTVGGAKPAFGVVGKSVKAAVRKYAPVEGDDTIEVAVVSSGLLYQLAPPSKSCTHVWWGANYYAQHLPHSSCWVFWDKENGASDFADGELAHVHPGGAAKLFRHRWAGMLKASEHGQPRVHPTQKPIELMRWTFETFMPTGVHRGVIVDAFLGSGPTLPAAEALGHRVLAMELSPEYVGLTLERMSTEFGLDVSRL